MTRRPRSRGSSSPGQTLRDHRSLPATDPGAACTAVVGRARSGLDDGPLPSPGVPGMVSLAPHAGALAEATELRRPCASTTRCTRSTTPAGSRCSIRTRCACGSPGRSWCAADATRPRANATDHLRRLVLPRRHPRHGRGPSRFLVLGGGNGLLAFAPILRGTRRRRRGSYGAVVADADHSTVKTTLPVQLLLEKQPPRIRYAPAPPAGIVNAVLDSSSHTPSVELV